jgi:hypothetical protein
MAEGCFDRVVLTNDTVLLLVDSAECIPEWAATVDLECAETQRAERAKDVRDILLAGKAKLQIRPGIRISHPKLPPSVEN